MKNLSILFLLVPALTFAHNVSGNIKIVPLKSMEFPDEIKNEMQNYNDESKKDGFVRVDNEYTRRLFFMRTKKLKFSQSQDPGEKELKKSISEVPINFSYKNIVPNPIAYLGIGLETKEGWSGIKTFFDGEIMGTCTLSVFNISQAKQPIKLNEDGLQYDVNDKPTRIGIEGHENSGFMYSVRWYDKNFVRDLQCANLRFDKEIIKIMIRLAKKIDSK